MEVFKRLDAKTPKYDDPFAWDHLSELYSWLYVLCMKTHLHGVRKKQCDSHLFSNIYSDGQSKGSVFFPRQN